MIGESSGKIKAWLASNKNDLFLVFTVAMVAVIGFALGRISVLRDEKFPIEIQAQAISSIKSSAESPAKDEKREGAIVGSKNGTVYHLEGCAGAERIKEENKIYFSSKEEAEKAGYRPAANCPGL